MKICIAIIFAACLRLLLSQEIDQCDYGFVLLTGLNYFLCTNRIKIMLPFIEWVLDLQMI